MKQQGAEDRALEWETGPAAEALEEFKTLKIHAGILAQVGCRHRLAALAGPYGRHRVWRRACFASVVGAMAPWCCAVIRLRSWSFFFAFGEVFSLPCHAAAVAFRFAFRRTSYLDSRTAVPL